jgi:hypothetical protein
VGTDCLEKKPSALLRSRYLGGVHPNTCPVRAVQECASAANIEAGPLFRACQDTAPLVGKRLTRIPFPLAGINIAWNLRIDTIKAALCSHQSGNANDGLLTEHAHFRLRSIFKSGRNRCHALFDKRIGVRWDLRGNSIPRFFKCGRFGMANMTGLRSSLSQAGLPSIPKTTSGNRAMGTGSYPLSIRFPKISIANPDAASSRSDKMERPMALGVSNV